MALVVLIVCRGLDESWLINQNDIHAKLLSWVWLHFFGHVREKLLYVCAVHMWTGHFFLWSLFTNVSTYFLNCRDIGSWEELLESSLSILPKKPNLGVSFGNYWRCSVHIFTTADWWNMHTFLWCDAVVIQILLGHLIFLLYSLLHSPPFLLPFLFSLRALCSRGDDWVVTTTLSQVPSSRWALRQVLTGQFSGAEHPPGVPTPSLPFLLCGTEHPNSNLLFGYFHSYPF